jgi:hypothetical protein
VTDERVEQEDEPLVIPDGKPVTIKDWITVPALLAVLAIAGLFASLADPARRASPANPFWFGVLAALLVSAIALAVFGYRAYRDLTPRSTLQFRIAYIGVGALAGLATLFGTLHAGVFVYAWTGYALALVPLERVRHVQSALTARALSRMWAWCVPLSIVGTIVAPLAFALQLVPLTVLAVAMVIIAPFAAGFVYGTRKQRADPAAVAK